MNNRLSEIKRRAAEATPGPWKACRINGDCFVERWDENNKPGELIAKRFLDGKERWDEGYETAAFIAHAREDVPWLISEIEKRDRVIERALTALKYIADHPNRNSLDLSGMAHEYHGIIEKELGNE